MLRVCTSQEYVIPNKANFPTIDAAFRPGHLFQMTVSRTHTVNLDALEAAMRALGVKRAILYFVVPEDIFPDFKGYRIVPAKSRLPATVRIYLLELLWSSDPAAAIAPSSEPFNLSSSPPPEVKRTVSFCTATPAA